MLQPTKGAVRRVRDGACTLAMRKVREAGRLRRELVELRRAIAVYAVGAFALGLGLGWWLG